MAAPRIAQFLAQLRAAVRTVMVATPSRVAIRSRTPSSSSGCTPRSWPARSSRRPWVRRRRASSHGLFGGHPTPPAASMAEAKSVVSHTGCSVRPSRSSCPVGLYGATASRPYGKCPGGYSV